VAVIRSILAEVSRGSSLQSYFITPRAHSAATAAIKQHATHTRMRSLLSLSTL
jgi:hypothetical protein